MRKPLLLATFALSLLALPAAAQKTFTKAHASMSSIKNAVKAKPVADAQTTTLTSVVAAYYTKASTGVVLDNYYLVLSDKSDATYDDAQGSIDATDAKVVTLDLYGPATGSTVLPAGEYVADGSVDDAEQVYDPDYSFADYYNASGKSLNDPPLISGNVNVTKNTDGTYTLTFADAEGTAYTYTGALSFYDRNGSNTVYPQITTDVNTTFTGGLAFYHGNLMESNTGNIYINLYDCDFDDTTGAMNGKGFNLSICAFNRLFGDPAQAKIIPGTYTVARNFQVNTYFPGMEIDYSGITVLMGTYIKQRKAMSGADSDYAFGYITDGTITITDGDESGTYNFEVDCTTDRGHKIKGTAKNISFNIIDMSDDDTKSAVSNLDHDVTLDLSYIKTARAYYTGRQNGVNVFVVDIGSPSGKDGNEGDLFKMEFQTSTSASELPAGTYELMEQNHLWTNLYAPYKLTQGYFDNYGELIGTRYWHFAKDRYQVVDTFASVITGRVGVEVLENKDYKFTIDCADGRGFLIQGEWTGPLELNYDTATAIDAISDDKKVGVHVSGSTVSVSGADADDKVCIYAADGQLVAEGKGNTAINTGTLGGGLYIVKVADKVTTKFVMK